MKAGATRPQIESVVQKIRDLGLVPHEIPGSTRVAIGITGNKGALDPGVFQAIEGVADAVPVSKPYKLVSREVHETTTVITFPNGVTIGGEQLAVFAGPCAVESRDQVMRTAEVVAKTGAKFLRGGAFKPRTSPYAFQGLKEEGLKILADARKATGLLVITEVKDTETLPLVEEYTDILQIGARNMQNFSLLEAVGKAKKPVMLKRGLSATIQEWLLAAEYVMSQGNYRVILCERGIRTFEPSTRNTLDLNAVPVLRNMTHLPIAVDPSHAVGISWAVPPLARAAVATGVDGLMVEIHPDPSKALSDGPQSLTLPQFESLMDEVRKIGAIVGKRV